ncbi:MAG: hypothetical protein KIT84_23675 [Labilithrix sp.]|nr:hypothetical protein [Labilithrix sp.]MCW5814048.1 hypothetical protein [Labilithrix sp.]
MKLTLVTSTMAALALFTLSSSAGAQTQTTRTADYTEQKDLAGDQVVKFTGDELGGLTGDADGLIKVRTGPVKVPLIRPRLNFVPELLKSVENL